MPTPASQILPAAGSAERATQALISARARKPFGLGDVGWFTICFLGYLLTFTAIVITGATVSAAHAGVPAAALADYLTGALTSPIALVAGTVTQWLLFIGFPALVGRRKGCGSLARDYGLRIRWRIDLPVGVALALLAQVVLGFLGNVIAPALGLDLTGSDNTGLITGHAGPMLVVMVAGAVLAAPLAEEVLFRGFLLRAAMRRWGGWAVTDAHGVPQHTRWGGAWISAGLSAVAFGVLHSSGQPGATLAGTALLMASTGLLGLMLGMVAVRARRLGPGLICHVTFNAVSVLVALLVH